jgi:ribosomal protein L13E
MRSDKNGGMEKILETECSKVSPEEKDTKKKDTKAKERAAIMEKPIEAVRCANYGAHADYLKKMEIVGDLKMVVIN